MKYLQLKLAECIARLLPRRVGYGIARRIADLYILFDRRGRECVIANLRRIHSHSGVHLSDRALRVLARENFLNFAKYLVDFFHFLHLTSEQLDRLVDFGDGVKILDELLAESHGVVILSAHIGNWELGTAVVAQRGYPLNGVALQQPNPKVDELYKSYRESRRLKVIPYGRAARGCIAALRKNELVGVMGDRDYTRGWHTVTFFGEEARLPDGPAKLALATGSPLLPVFCVRLPDDTYRMIWGKPLHADRAHDTVEDVMRRISRSLEEVISAHSEQWYLFHNLWDVAHDRNLARVAAFGDAEPEALTADDKPAATVAPPGLIDRTRA